MTPESRFPLPMVHLTATGCGAAAEVATADLRLNIGGEPTHLRIDVPTGPVGTRDLLPVWRGLAGLFIGAAERGAVQEGKSVSCRAGCGACCRQIVPVAPSEARHLAALVAALPEPRRSAVRARFADALSALEAAGLGEQLRAEASPQSFAVAYFHQGIPCPFLEEESCSIHPDRPVICREFLVTSPPEECARPEDEKVDRIPVPVSVAAAARGLEGGWVPLVRALEWAETHPEGPPSPGEGLLREMLSRVLGAKVE